MKLISVIAVLAAVLGSTSCMMPNPEKTRAKNEAVLFAEGFRVPFYKTTADGSYELDDKDTPVFTSGMAAPAFELQAAGQGTVSVGNPGSNGYLLFFAPSVNSPNSLKEMSQLAKWDAELQAAGVKPVAIMGDALDQISAAKDKYAISIPLLHDPGLEIATQYGCAVEGSSFAQRTLVGVDSSGLVVFFSRGYAFTGTKGILEAFGIDPKGK